MSSDPRTAPSLATLCDEYDVTYLRDKIYIIKKNLLKHVARTGERNARHFLIVLETMPSVGGARICSVQRECLRIPWGRSLLSSVAPRLAKTIYL